MIVDVIQGEKVMIIDKKGRIFGKISIIDIVIVFVLVMVVILAYKFFNKKEVVVNDETTSVVYTVEISDVPKEFADQVKKNEGEAVYNAVRNYYVGDIVNCEVKPFHVYKNNYEAGTVDKVEREGKYYVYVNIKASAKLSQKDISVGEQIIKVGTELPVKAKGFASNAWIVKVELAEEAK